MLDLPLRNDIVTNEGYLPSEKYPSDHLRIEAVFKFQAAKQNSTSDLKTKKRLRNTVDDQAI